MKRLIVATNRLRLPHQEVARIEIDFGPPEKIAALVDVLRVLLPDAEIVETITITHRAA